MQIKLYNIYYYTKFSLRPTGLFALTTDEFNRFIISYENGETSFFVNTENHNL